MDSLTQIALGAGVTEAVMQNKVGRKAALWGAICGTLPDLDVLIPMGDAIREFTYHRAESHAFLYMTLASPLVAWAIMRIHPSTKPFKWRWLIAVFLTFITHSLLDGFTAYGTQMLLPFTNQPVSWNSIFVVDPLYTLPLLMGVLSLFYLSKKQSFALRLNTVGLVLSSLYLVWGLGAKSHVRQLAEKTVQNESLEVNKLMIGPTPMNTLLWRVVGKTNDGYVEGFYSLLDATDRINFTAYTSSDSLINSLQDNWHVNRLQWFSNGFYTVEEIDQKVVMSDIRMGGNGLYVFRFVVGAIGENKIEKAAIQRLMPEDVNMGAFLGGIWHRIWDEQAQLYNPTKSIQDAKDAE